MPDVTWVNEKGQLTVVTVDDEGNRVDEPAVADVPEPLPETELTPTPEPFAGKGDHDHNGKVGGAAPPVKQRRRKRR